MRESKKYQEDKNNSMQNLVNHAQGDKALAEAYERGQRVSKKHSNKENKVTTKNSMY